MKVNVELSQTEYDDLNAFCLRAKNEAGLGRKVAAAQVIRILCQMAENDPELAARVYERLLIEGPTRHR